MQAYMRIGLCGGDACDMFYGTMNSCATGGAFFMSGIEVWQDFTGQDAVHEASGKTFNELSNGKTAQDEQQEIA